MVNVGKYMEIYIYIHLPFEPKWSPLFWLEFGPIFVGFFHPKIEDISRFQVNIYVDLDMMLICHVTCIFHLILIGHTYFPYDIVMSHMFALYDIDRSQISWWYAYVIDHMHHGIWNIYTIEWKKLETFVCTFNQTIKPLFLHGFIRRRPRLILVKHD